LIDHLLLVFSSIFIYEFLQYLKFTNILKSNLIIYKKIISLFKLKYASDFRKEKLILTYSKSLFNISIKILLIIIFILIFILILKQFSSSFLNLVISILGIVELSLIIFVYHKLRRKING